MRTRLLGFAGVLGVLGTVTQLGIPKKAHTVKRPATKPTVVADARTAEAKAIGKRLLARYRAGSLQLVRSDREPAQIQQLAAYGYCLSANHKPVQIAPILLRTLDRLSARATPTHPLALLSLYRPDKSNRPREPHANGLAADIWAYGGHRIDNRNVQECEAGVLAVINALGPGDYRLGVPKAPSLEPIPFLPPPPRPAAWPFFPAPVPVTFGYASFQVVLPQASNGRPRLSSRGGVRPAIRRWENERGAPLEEIQSHAVRSSLRTAILRGVMVPVLFPDAADHLHLDVMPPGPNRVIARANDRDQRHR